MPMVNNIYVYRDNHPDSPVLVLHGNGMRTATGNYVGVAGKIQVGQKIEKGSQYRICEDGAYNPENNHGAIKACERIGSAKGRDPQRANSYVEENEAGQKFTLAKASDSKAVVNHPGREKWVFVFGNHQEANQVG